MTIDHQGEADDEAKGEDVPEIYESEQPPDRQAEADKAENEEIDEYVRYAQPDTDG
jgi:hypothetical protein